MAVTARLSAPDSADPLPQLRHPTLNISLWQPAPASAASRGCTHLCGTQLLDGRKRCNIDRWLADDRGVQLRLGALHTQLRRRKE
jgi:hypothetical protein